MASFSYQQHHPILVDSILSLDQYHQIQNNNNNNNNIQDQFYNNLLVSQPHHQTVHGVPVDHVSSGMVMNNNSENDTSFVTKTCCTTLSSDENDEPYCSSVSKKHSTDESGEQVTQKVERKRKVATRNNNSAQSKDAREKSRGGGSKKQKSGGGNNDKKGSEKKVNGKKNDEGKKGKEEPPTGFIHVRARRGQATDSHSLAERVRREKISERMKMLQRLVPGCEKVTGKALMLDEIINYVQSLQNQVEFLSMKLSSLNPMFYDFGMDIDNTFVVTPEGMNNLASQIQAVPQCSQSQPTADNNNYQATLIDTSSASLLLQQNQRPNAFSHENVSLLWDMEDQRHSFFNLNPSLGFNNFQLI